MISLFYAATKLASLIVNYMVTATLHLLIQIQYSAM